MRIWLDMMLKKQIGQVVDWSKIEKEDYLMAMERSPIKDIEIKYILNAALTDQINDREFYMKGIDHSYYYEGYVTYKTEELQGGWLMKRQGRDLLPFGYLCQIMKQKNKYFTLIYENLEDACYNSK